MKGLSELQLFPSLPTLSIQSYSSLFHTSWSSFPYTKTHALSSKVAFMPPTSYLPIMTHLLCRSSNTSGHTSSCLDYLTGSVHRKRFDLPLAGFFPLWGSKAKAKTKEDMLISFPWVFTLSFGPVVGASCPHLLPHHPPVPGIILTLFSWTFLGSVTSLAHAAYTLVFLLVLVELEGRDKCNLPGNKVSCLQHLERGFTYSRHQDTSCKGLLSLDR